MPPKAAAEKKPSATAGKAPAGKAPAEKKEAGKKTAAPSGDKKKRTKTRKETYSSYIYKGLCSLAIHSASLTAVHTQYCNQLGPMPSFGLEHVFTFFCKFTALYDMKAY